MKIELGTYSVVVRETGLEKISKLVPLSEDIVVVRMAAGIIDLWA
jgi:hypothetical protein